MKFSSLYQEREMKMKVMIEALDADMICEFFYLHLFVYSIKKVMKLKC